ncbi:hypothetical protein ACIRSU_12750 [Streptomyces sp. NPDC101160]|uniref:hypothetical protein n=1 Tax=Streptomyces sp. NPDC101160 TaxID=3366118 RepID=UPI0037FA00D1
MFAVIYRWRLQPGLEEQFVEGWHRVTAAIRLRCGSYGSRLHQTDDGTWVAYARWPDAATRDRCGTVDAEGLTMMREAVEERFPEIRMQIVDDMLAEPNPAPDAALLGGS